MACFGNPIFSINYGTILAGYCIILAVEESESQFNAELLKRVAASDERAFATLYERLAPALYGMAFRIMNDAGEAEEVLQEGFTYIWRRASAFDPARSSAFAWAVMIVRNKAIDKLRVRRRGERLRERVTNETDLPGASDEQSAHRPALRERSALVRSALEQIAPDQRQALELAFFSGLTHVQIAEHLEAPLGTVKARIRRGLVKMRDFFHEPT
ncbi:MAG: sigma-70 family RNA polymerase sigma factor [Chthoniobacterales bacterium]